MAKPVGDGRGEICPCEEKRLGLVENALVKKGVILSTVNHPVYQEVHIRDKVTIENSDPGPGSSIWDTNWMRFMEAKFGIKAHGFMGSRLPREWPLKAIRFETTDPGGIQHKLPLFTMGTTFDNLSPAEASTLMKRMKEGFFEFVNDIERREGELSIIHGSHLFLNAVYAGKLNAARLIAGKEPIPIVLTAHGTALKFYKRVALWESMSVSDSFGSPLLPRFHNIAIGPDAFEFLDNNYRELLKQKSEYARDTLGMSAYEMLQRLVTPKTAGWREYIEPYILRGVAAIAAISGKTADDVTKAFPDYPTDNIVRIPNGFDDMTFSRNTGLDRRSVLSSLITSETSGRTDLPENATKADIVVVMTGKIVDWKNADKLIMAAAGHNPHAPEGQRRFVGYEDYFARKGLNVVTIHMGTNKDDLKLVRETEALPSRLGAKNVFFLGMVHPSIVAKVNNIGNVGVFPSWNEPQGMVAQEAMACGLPCLVGTGGFREIVDSKVGGHISPTDPQDINRMVIRAVEENWRGTKADAMQERIRPYTWTVRFGEYSDLYERVADWVKHGHPEDVHAPRRLTYLATNGAPRLWQVRFSPYKVAAKIVQMVGGDADKAAEVAEYVKRSLRHGWAQGSEKARDAIQRGYHFKTLEKIKLMAK